MNLVRKEVWNFEKCNTVLITTSLISFSVLHFSIIPFFKTDIFGRKLD